MKEVEYDDFIEHYDEYIEILRKTGDVWLLINEGQKELVVMHKETYDKMHNINIFDYLKADVDRRNDKVL